jgi:hypothetical protein
MKNGNNTKKLSGTINAVLRKYMEALKGKTV